MPGHRLITAHLHALAQRLPAEVVDELADGLTDTYHHHLARGLPPAQAATAATAEFGHPDQITAAFVRHAPGRRAALLLLATGPPLALCWAAALITAHVWTWPLPAPAIAGFALALGAVVAALVAAASTRRHYRRTRLAGPGAVGIVVLDCAMLTAVLLAAPHVAWPMAAAIAASLARIGLVARLGWLAR